MYDRRWPGGQYGTPGYRELMDLHYIGFKSARQVLAVVRKFERDAEAPPVGTP